MAGYEDTRQMIINTLTNRLAGTEIQPEDHQAFALQLTEYIRQVELVAGSGVPVAFAEQDTVPVQPDNGQAVYLSYVPRSVTKNFVNFINQSGNSISVTSSSGEVKLVTLLWNGSYWSSQIVTIDVLSDDSSVNASNIGASDYILFSTSSNYSIGDIVRYDGKLYKFTTEHAAGTWIGTDVELASINSILTSKLSELEFESGGIAYGKDVESSLVSRSNYIPCKDGDIVSGYIYRINLYDKNYNYIKEEGQEYGGDKIVSHTISDASCAFIRIVCFNRYKYIFYINDVSASYLINKQTNADHGVLLQVNDAQNKIRSNMFSCVFKITEDVLNKPILFAVKDLSIVPVNGYLYTLVIKNTSTWSQISLYRALSDSPKVLEYCGSFVPEITSQRSGIEKYEKNFNTGEKASTIVDWDEAKDMAADALYPDIYVLKPEVFNGGLLSNRFIPQYDVFDTRISTLEHIVDAEGYLPEERYWAVCGDSITNANHYSIEDIAESDPYLPFDGYKEVSTYKRKNYAYYIAQMARLKWANYGWGGTTLTSVKSKAYGYRNAFVDSRMRNLANKDWDFISIFFGENDFWFGPTAHRDKWLKETFGEDIGYPVEDSQIGQEGFATLEQKERCDAAVGEVYGVNYTDNNEYFLAKFIGDIDSEETDTWYGALNVSVKYLLGNNPHAKLILIAPYGPSSPKLADAVVKVAKKWGVNYFDFRSVPYWPTYATADFSVLRNEKREDGKWISENGYVNNFTLYGRNLSIYLYDGTHPTNRGYYTMANLLKDAILK